MNFIIVITDCYSPKIQISSYSTKIEEYPFVYLMLGSEQCSSFYKTCNILGHIFLFDFSPVVSVVGNN